MSWYVVSTKPNQENRANLNLRKQGFEVLLPMIQKKRRHARQIEFVLRPLFPGYLFVEFDPDSTQWSSINGTFGVKALLTCKGRPQPIYSDFITSIKGLLNSEYVMTMQPEEFQPGQKVAVIDGPMQGHVATIVNADDHGRARIMLSMMGRETISTIGVEYIEVAS